MNNKYQFYKLWFDTNILKYNCSMWQLFVPLVSKMHGCFVLLERIICLKVFKDVNQSWNSNILKSYFAMMQLLLFWFQRYMVAGYSPRQNREEFSGYLSKLEFIHLFDVIGIEYLFCILLHLFTKVEIQIFWNPIFPCHSQHCSFSSIIIQLLGALSENNDRHDKCHWKPKRLFPNPRCTLCTYPSPSPGLTPFVW